MTKKSLLRLRTLKFVSLVDLPANEHSVCVVKRAGSPDEVSATCRIVKIDETLGVLIGFANASTVNGASYVDLQGDVTSEDELIKVCLEYAEAGAPVDEMHNEQAVDGAKTVFLFPLTGELAKSLGLGDVQKTGILFGVKVPPAVIARARKGEINGFSIGGLGTREPVEKAFSEIVKASESAAENAEDEFESGLHDYQKANGLPEGRGINGFLQTSAGRESYRKFALAREEAIAVERAARNSETVHPRVKLEKRAVAMEALEKGLTAFAQKNNITKNIWTDGLAVFRETDEGRALVDAVNE